MIWCLSKAAVAGVGGVEQHVALVEERRLRRVQVFGGRIGIERAPAEGDHAALQVGDREHDAVAEAVVADRDVVAGDQHAGDRHVGGLEAGLGEMLLECRPAAGRVAQAEAGDGAGGQAALVEVAARLQRRPARAKLRLEEAGGRLPARRRGGCARPRTRPRAGWAWAWRTPASSASRSTASGKLRPSVSMTNLKMSPFCPEEKSNQEPLWSLTKNEGVFSCLKGDRPFSSRPARFSATLRATTWLTGEPGADLVEQGRWKAHGGPNQGVGLAHSLCDSLRFSSSALPRHPMPTGFHRKKGVCARRGRRFGYARVLGSLHASMCHPGISRSEISGTQVLDTSPWVPALRAIALRPG